VVKKLYYQSRLSSRQIDNSGKRRQKLGLTVNDSVRGGGGEENSPAHNLRHCNGGKGRPRTNFLIGGGGSGKMFSRTAAEQRRERKNVLTRRETGFFSCVGSCRQGAQKVGQREYRREVRSRATGPTI